MLTDNERGELTRDLRSSGVAAGPWRSPGGSGRTYALLRFETDDAGLALTGLDAVVHEPALTVLEIEPLRSERLGALAEALGGAGAPVGVSDCLVLSKSLLLELDEARTPLATVMDVVDIELARTPGRRIVPVLGLSDERLTSLAAALLRDPELDASRLIETYTEAMGGRRP